MNVPDGKLEMVVTYLEMKERPTDPGPPAPAKRIALMRAENPSVAFYRFLYDTVGGNWIWYERRLMNDDELASIIHDKNVEIYVLYVSGTPAGYAELDLRKMPDVELAYFGMMPGFTGQGLGRYLLRWAIDQAWSRQPDRLWLHTCNFDDPRALGMYQRAGFAPYHQETELIDDPGC